MSKAWPMVPLGEALIERQEVPSAEAVAKGDIRIVAKIGFKDGQIQLRNGSETKTGMILVRPGDILISGINATKGAIAIYGEENTEPIAATIHYGAYIPKKDRVDVKYLWWLLRSKIFQDLLDRYVPGGIKTELKAKRLLPIPVPLPFLEEQQRIIAKIDELAVKIEEVRKLNGDVAIDSKILLESARLKIFQEMAGRHGLRKLDEVSPINMGQSPPGSSYNTFGDGVPLLNGPTEFGEKHPVPVQWTTAPTKLCKPGDILLCVRGATTGRLNWADKEYCIGRGLAALTPNPKICLPEYIYHFVETQTQEMLGLAAGSTFPNLPGEKLKVLEIPVPPIPEQRRVVAYLDSIQEKMRPLKHLQSETAVEIQALLPSLLDKAFKGEL